MAIILDQVRWLSIILRQLHRLIGQTLSGLRKVISLVGVRAPIRQVRVHYNWRYLFFEESKGLLALPARNFSLEFSIERLSHTKEGLDQLARH